MPEWDSDDVEILDRLTELFALSYKTGNIITVSPPPVGDWHIVINGHTFSSRLLLDSIEEAISYMEAEEEHEMAKTRIREIPYS